LVPVKRLEQMRRFVRWDALEFMHSSGGRQPTRGHRGLGLCLPSERKVRSTR
jgi:hypothetical protein